MDALVPMDVGAPMDAGVDDAGVADVADGE
jgi:hypothetical protein